MTRTTGSGAAAVQVASPERDVPELRDAPGQRDVPDAAGQRDVPDAAQREVPDAAAQGDVAGERDAATEPDDRREAVRGLESAFSLLFTQMRRAYAQAAAGVSPGLLPGTFKVLTVIDHIGPVSASTLAERMEQDKGLISRAVTELEALDLIERTPDPADGRVRLITLSTLGRERLQAVRFPFVDRLDEALEGWPNDSITRLSELLQALATNIVPRD